MTRITLKKCGIFFLFSLLVVHLSMGQGSYNWNNAGGGDFGTTTNWTPERTTPDPGDILLFNNGGTYTVTGLPTQTIKELIITGNTNVTLSASAAATLTITGAVGTDDFEVQSGSSLTLGGTSAILLTISTGATGLISGTITATGAAHKILPADASSLFFQSGSIITQATGCTGNIFNNSGTANAVIFESGSTFVQQAGSNPFGLTQPASRIIFQTGSLFKMEANLSPGLSGRTYANFEINFATFSQNNMTGGNPLVVDNFTITSATLANFNLTGNVTINGNISILAGTVAFNPTSSTGTTSIKGNINVSGGSLAFNPSVSRNTNLNGPVTQTISGTVTFGSNTNVINSQNLIINGTVSCTNLESSNQLTVGAAGSLTVSGILTLKSGSSFLPYNGSTVSIGSSSVELNLPNAAQWYYFSIPVTSALASTICDVSTEELYQYNTAGSAWSRITDGGATLSPAKGYAVRLAAPKTITFTGTLNDGSVSPIISNAGNNWWLVGNPYPSAIDYGCENSPVAGWTMTNLRSTFYIRTNGQFAWWNWSGDGLASTTPAGSRYVANSQAIWIKVLGDAPAFTMTNPVRLHNSVGFLKAQTMYPILRLYAYNGENADEAVIRFIDDAENDFDKYDAEKRFTDDTRFAEIYTVSDNTKMVLNTYPETGNRLEIPLGFRCKADGQYTIRVSEMANFPADVSILLADNQLNKIVDLNITQSYTFFSTVTDNSSRFTLYFIKGLVPDDLSGDNGIAAGMNENNLNRIKIYGYNNQIVVSSPETTGKIMVYDLTGKLVTDVNMNGNNYSINVENKGYYMVKVATSQQVITRKVFVK